MVWIKIWLFGVACAFVASALWRTVEPGSLVDAIAKAFFVYYAFVHTMQILEKG